MALDEQHGLIERLIQSLRGPDVSQNGKSYNQLRERVHATVKAFQAPRSNHFAIYDRIEGLAERAEVFNRADLAASIRDRVALIQRIDDKFVPEYLALLLELSDRPVENTEIEDVTHIARKDASAPVDWSEILREEPLDNSDGIWDNVNFAEEGSISDEDQISFISKSSAETTESIEMTDDPRLSHDLQANPDLSVSDLVLREVHELRSRWQTIKELPGAGSTLIPEQEMVREVIAMLCGFETELFEITGDTIKTRPNVTMEQVSRQLSSNVLFELASLGCSISRLRKKTRLESTIPVIQTFQSVLSAKLLEFDDELLKVDERCMQSSPEPVTILEILSTVRALSNKVTSVSKLLPNDMSGCGGEHVLEALFELTCIQQSLGDAQTYESSLSMFKMCFDTYLQPVLHWLALGEIDPDCTGFFIQESEIQLPPSAFWSAQFALVYDSKSKVLAPDFLQKFVTKILNVGKSRRFLCILQKELGSISMDQFSLSAHMVHRGADLIPFGQIFEDQFGQWLNAIHLEVTTLLSGTLSRDCGLQNAMIALHALFLGQDGPALDYVADAFLQRLVDLPRSLTDSLTLMSIYHEGYTSSICIDEDKISVRILSTGATSAKLGPLLDQIEVSYKLSWVMSNIVHGRSLILYRRAHAILLRLRIAKRAVDQKFHQQIIRHGARDQASTMGVRLCQHLRWLIHTLEDYFLGLGLQDSVLELHRKLHETGDIDEKIEAHNDFVSLIECRFLLKPQATRAYQAVQSALDLALAAARHLQGWWQALYSAEHHQTTTETGLLSENGKGTKAIKEYLQTYRKILVFVRTGIQETARVEGEKSLQMLADILSVE